MKSTIFVLANPDLHSENDEHGFIKSWGNYKVPVLPAYAIQNYTIQGIQLNLDGGTNAIESVIVGDTVVIYGVDDLVLAFNPTEPTLVVNYLGIRDYQPFFPHFENQSLRERAAKFLEEADKTFEESSWLAFAMMAGAVFESLLFDMAGDKRDSFGPLIGKVKKKDIFNSMEIAALETANNARNLVHAGRHGDPYITREKAMTVRVVLEQFLRYDWAEIKREYSSWEAQTDA